MNKLTPTHTAVDVANWFLAWTNDDDTTALTPNRVRGLLYLSQGYSLATGQPVFNDSVKVYPNGPQVDSIATKYADTPNDSEIVLSEDFDFNTFTTAENKMLASIWETYKTSTGDELLNLGCVSLSNDAPYVARPLNEVITQDEAANIFRTAIVRSAFTGLVQTELPE